MIHWDNRIGDDASVYVSEPFYSPDLRQNLADTAKTLKFEETDVQGQKAQRVRRASRGVVLLNAYALLHSPPFPWGQASLAKPAHDLNLALEEPVPWERWFSSH